MKVNSKNLLWIDARFGPMGYFQEYIYIVDKHGQVWKAFGRFDEEYKYIYHSRYLTNKCHNDIKYFTEIDISIIE